MSLKKVHDKQPNSFNFSSENLKKIEIILKNRNCIFSANIGQSYIENSVGAEDKFEV